MRVYDILRIPHWMTINFREMMRVYHMIDDLGLNADLVHAGRNRIGKLYPYYFLHRNRP